MKKVFKKLAGHIIVFKTSLAHYKCEAYFIRCIDQRFKIGTSKLLKFLRIHFEDPGVFAGAAKPFASPEKEEYRQFVLKQLEISIKAHGTERVILMNHADCAAYGGRARFAGNAKEERTFHEQELKKARKVILGKFPDIKVELFYNNENGIRNIK